MFIITAFSGNVNLFFKKILSRRRDGRARVSAARLAALALDSMDRGASRLEPTARFCPSPRPRPSPAPAGTAEGPLSIAAALSFASPRRDGGGAFVHPRGPVLRQPPPGRRRGLYPSPQPCPSPASLAKGRGTAVRRWRDSAPSSALGAGIPVSSAPPPAWPTEAGSPEAQRRMSRCKTGIRLQQARRSGPAPPGPWRPC